MGHEESNRTEQTPILEIKGLVKRFGQRTVQQFIHGRLSEQDLASLNASRPGLFSKKLN